MKSTARIVRRCQNRLTTITTALTLTEFHKQVSSEEKSVKEPDFDFQKEEVAVEAEALSVCIGYSDVLQVIGDIYLEPYVL